MNMPFGTLVLLSLLVLVAVLPIVYLTVVNRRIDLFLPPTIFCGYVIMGYVSPVPSFVERRDSFSQEWPIGLSNLESSLAKALVVVLFGVIAYYLGYFVLS